MQNSNDLEKLNDTWIWYSDTYDESFSFRITKYLIKIFSNVFLPIPNFELATEEMTFK